jgi:signal transduction histidine kinase/CheY-like chemotaxis protein
VKGFLVVVLPVLVLTLISGAVYVTGRAHQAAEQRREAAESVNEAVDQLSRVAAAAPTAFENHLASGTAATGATIEQLETDWLAAVRSLQAAAHAQADPRLMADAEVVQAGTDVLFEEIGAALAEPAGSPGIEPARLERMTVAYESINTATSAMAARSERFAIELAAEHDDLSTKLNALLLVGTPVGILSAILGMVIFARSIVRRVRQLEANARALGEGNALVPQEHGDDELGQLGRGLDVADALLRERAETVRQGEQNLGLALKAGDMGTWSVDLATGASEWSSRCEVVHGVAPGTFGGSLEAWLDVVHVDDRARVLTSAAGPMAEGGRWTTVYRAIGTTGEVRWVESHGQTVADDDGAVIALVGVAADVTSRVATDTALREAIVEAERANAAKSEFLSRVSHELRTPLNAILGFAQLLEMEDLTAGQDESVEHVLRGGRHLLAVIDDVLDISRIESGTLSMSLEPVGLGELLGEMIALVAPLASERQVILELLDIGGDDLHVVADRRRLKQVILNLASNAIKFNHPGGRVVFTASVSAPNRVRVDVTDTGQGVPEDLLERLFTPFDRLGAEQTDVEGAGIGLALSQRLIEAQGGHITVETEVGSGSTFSFDLPLAQRHSIAPIEDGGQLDAQPSGSILYIEDNPSNLKLLQRVLERRPDIKMLSAQTGEIGLSMASRVPVDLILLDLHLPDISGEVVLRRLRESAATSTTPVIILSADATPSRIARLRDGGATDYLTKPLDLARLLGVLDSLLVGAPT